MATVQVLKSPQALLDYLNSIDALGVFRTDYFVMDSGGFYTVIEEVPDLVTTLKSPDALKAHLESLAGTFVDVVPKKEGGFFTFVSLANETFGGANGLSMIIAPDPKTIELAIDAGTLVAIIDHGTKTVIIHT